MDFTQADHDLINREFEELRLASLKRCASQEEYEAVLKAFDFANDAHKGVRRRSGEPYILHPIAVAKIVVQEIGLGYKSIIAALLHDVVEDTEFTTDDIKRLFGEKIASLVDGLTKIKAAMDTEGGTLQAENFKRILLTLNDDVRIVLIKLADRLHNLRTIEFMPEYKKEKILSESMYIFVPLAHRLGLYGIKSEMENIWLMHKEPQAYNNIQESLDRIIAERGEAMDQFIEPISTVLNKAGYKFTIFKRTKTPYSIWHKMETKGIPFDEIFDIYAVRIIFEAKKNEEERVQCWHIYSLISGIYTSKTNRIRDWVNKPKSNGYEALHCTVMSKIGSWVEIQIRSTRMNEIAEKGVAAHWSYKGLVDGKRDEKEMNKWLNMVREVLENPDADALEFLDKFHDTLLTTDIYVFTPKGESRSLPKGSTALDFAYSIHSHIGNKAIAAKVNLKLVPLSKELQNGDQVEIITAESQKPQREWLNFLKTGKARGAVYDAIKEDIEDSITEGRKRLEEELAKSGIKLQSRVLKKLLPAYKVATKEELYNKIAAGIIDLSEIDKILRKNSQSKNVIYWTLQLFNPSKEGKEENYEEDEEHEEHEEHEDELEGKTIKKNTVKKVEKNRDYILEENPIEKTLSYRVSECCYPIPGDNVVGFMEKSGEVIIHKKTCPIATNLAAVEGDSIVNVKWSKHTILSSLARIKINGVDRMGILNEITKFTTLVLNINIRKVYVETHDGIFNGYIDCYVHNIEDLETLMNHFRKIKGVESVTRVDVKDN